MSLGNVTPSVVSRSCISSSSSSIIVVVVVVVVVVVAYMRVGAEVVYIVG